MGLLLVVFDDSLTYPVGESLTVVRNDKPFAVFFVLDVAEFEECRYGCGFSEHVKTAVTNSALKPAAWLMLAVFVLDSVAYVVGKASAQSAVWSVV